MRVTLRDVAKAAETSVASASATLHGTRGETIRVSEGTRARIRAVAAQLGYVANPIAKSLATGKTRSLGLVLPYADAFLDQNPFCSQVMHGVMREVVRRHYNLMLHTATGGIRDGEAVLSIDSRVDGLLVVMPPSASPAVQRCEQRGIPYMAVLCKPEDALWSVNSDDETGGRLAAEHLIGLGHRRIAHLVGSKDVASTAPRAVGFMSAMDQHGLPVHPDLIVDASFSTEGGYRAMRQILDGPASKRPTAVFAANDLCADGAIRAAREFGLDVPGDIAVVGYDDTWFATMTQPPLTSVHMPIAEMGETAASMLIERVEGREPAVRQAVLPVSLTVRQSCGAPAAFVSAGDDAVSPVPSMRN